MQTLTERVELGVVVTVDAVWSKMPCAMVATTLQGMMVARECTLMSADILIIMADILIIMV
jgi:hypothetical protein